MKKKGQMSNNTVGVLIVLFIGIVVSLALFTPIGQTVNKMNQKQVATNQSVSTTSAYIDSTNVNTSTVFTIYSSQSLWKQQSCPLTSVAIRNGAGTALTANTDYTLNASTATFTLLNTTKTIPSTSLNTTYVDYTYCADGYNTDSGSRGMNTLLIIGLALALLAFVISNSNVREWISGFSR